MEYNKENCTPLDRLDEHLIAELLGNNTFSEKTSCDREESRSENSCSSCRERTRRDTRRRRPVPCDRHPLDRLNERISDCGRDNHVVCSEKPEREGCREKTCSDRCSNCEESERHACGCGDCSPFVNPTLHGNPLAMVYSPHQEWDNLYDPEEGHSRGTVFKCLDFPFYPARCRGNSWNSCDKGCR